jgi:hypothetical protein
VTVYVRRILQYFPVGHTFAPDAAPPELIVEVGPATAPTLPSGKSIKFPESQYPPAGIATDGVIGEDITQVVVSMQLTVDEAEIELRIKRQPEEYVSAI